MPMLHAQSCLTLCDPMACCPPGSSVHGILQARILEWVAISSSRGSSQLRDQTHISCVSWMVGWILYHWASREAHPVWPTLNAVFRGRSWKDFFFFSGGNVNIGLNSPNLRREISACDYSTRSFHTSTLCISGPIWMPLGQSISILTVLPIGLESF